MVSGILLANLVISHSLTGKISESNMFCFYFPKVILTLMIWVTFYGYVFSEGMVILHRHLVTNDFNPESLGLKIIEVRLFSFYVKNIHTVVLLHNNGCLHFICWLLWTERPS